MDYDEAVKKGAIYVPGYNPPGGTVAAAQKRREEETQAKKSQSNWGGGSGGSGSGGCFVATAAYGNYDAPEVVFLRAFRDESLSQSVPGRAFVRAYYAISPPLANFIARSGSLRGLVRKFFLQPIIFVLQTFKR